jgi:hypothetical protein
LTKARLNDLQNDFLREFFGRENRFYLTGGAALVGFYSQSLSKEKCKNTL